MITEIYADYFDNLIKGNRSACLQTVKELLDDGIDIKTLYLDLFQGTLYEVGELWEGNRISVASEHLATSITESAMGMVQPLIFSRDRCGKKSVVACAANEFHQVGGKMVADILELHGWDGYFLGANTPIADLLAMVREKHPDLVCLSLSIYSNLPQLIKTIEALQEEFPQIEIRVGGQAFRWGGREAVEQYPGVRLFPTLDDLEQYLMG
ncbi:MAG: cobalamin-dependent protein [Syntrophotaleaceae bacterium]